MTVTFFSLALLPYLYGCNMYRLPLALLLLVPGEDAQTILLAATAAKMTNGDIAIFLVDVFEPLLLTDHGTLVDNFRVKRSDFDLDFAAALEVTMVVKAHAEPFLGRNNHTRLSLISKVIN